MHIMRTETDCRILFLGWNDDRDNRAIFLVDLNGRNTITNNHDTVYNEAVAQYGDFPVVYRDTSDHWAEILPPEDRRHLEKSGNMTFWRTWDGYKPSKEEVEEAIRRLPQEE